MDEILSNIMIKFCWKLQKRMESWNQIYSAPSVRTEKKNNVQDQTKSNSHTYTHTNQSISNRISITYKKTFSRKCAPEKLCLIEFDTMNQSQISDKCSSMKNEQSEIIRIKQTWIIKWDLTYGEIETIEKNGFVTCFRWILPIHSPKVDLSAPYTHTHAHSNSSHSHLFAFCIQDTKVRITKFK